MGLSAVNPKVWAVILAVFVLAFLVRRLRVRWVRRRRRLAERLAAGVRARSARSTDLEARRRRQGAKRP